MELFDTRSPTVQWRVHLLRPSVGQQCFDVWCWDKFWGMTELSIRYLRYNYKKTALYIATILVFHLHCLMPLCINDIFIPASSKKCRLLPFTGVSIHHPLGFIGLSIQAVFPTIARDTVYAVGRAALPASRDPVRSWREQILGRFLGTQCWEPQ